MACLVYSEIAPLIDEFAREKGVVRFLDDSFHDHVTLYGELRALYSHRTGSAALIQLPQVHSAARQGYPAGFLVGFHRLREKLESNPFLLRLLHFLVQSGHFTAVLGLALALGGLVFARMR